MTSLLAVLCPKGQPVQIKCWAHCPSNHCSFHQSYLVLWSLRGYYFKYNLHSSAACNCFQFGTFVTSGKRTNNCIIHPLQRDSCTYILWVSLTAWYVRRQSHSPTAVCLKHSLYQILALKYLHSMLPGFELTIPILPLFQASEATSLLNWLLSTWWFCWLC